MAGPAVQVITADALPVSPYLTAQNLTALLRHVISITNCASRPPSYDVVRGVLTDPLKLVEHICNFVCDVLKLDEANQKKI